MQLERSTSLGGDAVGATAAGGGGAAELGRTQSMAAGGAGALAAPGACCAACHVGGSRSALCMSALHSCRCHQWRASLSLTPLSLPLLLPLQACSTAATSLWLRCGGGPRRRRRGGWCRRTAVASSPTPRCSGSRVRASVGGAVCGWVAVGLCASWSIGCSMLGTCSLSLCPFAASTDRSRAYAICPASLLPTEATQLKGNCPDFKLGAWGQGGGPCCELPSSLQALRSFSSAHAHLSPRLARNCCCCCCCCCCCRSGGEAALHPVLAGLQPFCGGAAGSEPRRAALPAPALPAAHPRHGRRLVSRWVGCWVGGCRPLPPALPQLRGHLPHPVSDVPQPRRLHCLWRPLTPPLTPPRLAWLGCPVLLSSALPCLCSACTSGYDAPVRAAIAHTLALVGASVTPDAMTRRNTHLILPLGTGKPCCCLPACPPACLPATGHRRAADDETAACLPACRLPHGRAVGGCCSLFGKVGRGHLE